MRAVVQHSDFNEQRSYVVGPGIRGSLLADWRNIINVADGEARFLNEGEVVEFDIDQNPRGYVRLLNIRVLAGAAEREFLSTWEGQERW